MTADRSAAALAGAAALAAAALGALLALAAARVGVAAFALPLVAGVGLLVLARPRVGLAITLVVVVLAEGDTESFLGAAAAIYELPLQVHELLIAAVLAGLLLERARTRTPLRVPGPFTLPLLLLACALAAGGVVGVFAGADRIQMANEARDLVVLLVLPFLAVNLIDGRDDVIGVLKLVAVLAAAKAGLGAVGWALGAGRPIEGTVLTYYEPLPNLLLLFVVLGVLAAAMDRAPTPVQLRWLALFSLAVLILSFRRNFWIAIVLGVVVVVLVGTGARGRMLLIPSGALVAVALWVGLTALSSAQSQSPVIQRAQSLAPSRLQALSDDRYRLDEQRNVRAELAVHPLTGLGLGVPWAARYPLAEYFPGGRQYTHVTAFWWWMKLGLLGLITYVWLLGAGVRSGLALWRRALDPPVRWAGLGVAAGLLGLAVAETTGSFVGVESRLTVFIGLTFGWLAAALALRDDASTAP